LSVEKSEKISKHLEIEMDRKITVAKIE